MGAWIETSTGADQYRRVEESHPIWVRGLKRNLDRDGLPY